MNILIIIFIILLSIIIAIEIKANYYLEQNCLNLDFWKQKNKIIHTDLLDLLFLMKYYLDKHKIIYWAHAGTLLGVYRHNGFIPWDDDIDLAVLYEKEKILNFLEDLKKNNIHIFEIFFGFRIFKKKAAIDIFYLYTNNENNMLEQNAISRLIWPKEDYNIEQVFDLKYKMFENILIPVPNKAEEYLSKVFGSDYMNTIYIHPSHNIDDMYHSLLVHVGCNKKYNMSQIY